MAFEYLARDKVAEEFVCFSYQGTADEARTAVIESALDLGLRMDSQPEPSDISFREPWSWLRRPVTLDVRVEEQGRAARISVLGSSMGSGAGQLAYTDRVVGALSSRVGLYAADHGGPAKHRRRRWVLRWLGVGQVAPIPFVVVPAVLILIVGGWVAYIASAAWFCVFALVPSTCEVVRRHLVGLGQRDDLFLLAGCVIAAAAVSAFVWLASL